MSSADLRPLSLGELLDRTFTLYRSHFWLFIGIMAVPQLLAIVLNVTLEILQQHGLVVSSGGIAGARGPEFTMLAAVLVVVSWVLIILDGMLYALALGATTLAVSEVYLGRSVTIRDAYGNLRGRLWRLIRVAFSIFLRFFGLLVLAAVAMAILIPSLARSTGQSNPIVMGLFFLVLVVVAVALGVWVVLRYGVAIPALLLENLKARQAMKRSVSLTSGYRGRVFLTLLLMGIVTYAAVLLFQGPFLAAIMMTKGGAASLWLRSLAVTSGGIGGALTGPLAMIALSLLYYDVRVRKEAFDLQMMMAALQPGGPSPETPPAVTGA